MTLTGICENKNYAKFRQKMAGQDSNYFAKNYLIHSSMQCMIVCFTKYVLVKNKIEENDAFWSL